LLLAQFSLLLQLQLGPCLRIVPSEISDLDCASPAGSLILVQDLSFLYFTIFISRALGILNNGLKFTSSDQDYLYREVGNIVFRAKAAVDKPPRHHVDSCFRIDSQNKLLDSYSVIK
jgi:hypothetical protein